MYYISNETDFFPQSTDIFNSEIEYERKKMYLKKYFYCFYFLVVHILTNNVLNNLTFSMLLGRIHVEGTVSQIIF